MNQIPAEQPRYPIRAVARMVGIPPPTLRSWERRYGFPAPSRSATSRRLYSQVDIDAILWLKGQLAQGLSLGQAVQWYAGGRFSASTPAARGAGAPGLGAPSPAPDSGQRCAALIDRVVHAAAAYDEGGLEAVLSTAFAVDSPDRVLMQLIVPAQRVIGERWRQGMLAVTAEHFASNVFRHRILMLMAQMPAASLGPAILLACVPGEEHDLGLLMLALFLRWQGLHPLYLGANVPAGYLLDCLQATHAAALCLSAVTSDSAPALAETVAEVAPAAAGVRVFTGGAGSHGLQLGPGTVNFADDLLRAAEAIASELRLPASPATDTSTRQD